MEWKQWLYGKEKVLGAVLSKWDHFDIILGHESNHHYWFSLKKVLLKTILIDNSLGKTHLIYLLNLVYIYIYIYVSKFGDHSRGWPEDILFINNYIEA